MNKIINRTTGAELTPQFTPAPSYLSLWKGEDNGNNEVAGKPEAVWNYLDAYATGKVGRCFYVREVPWPEGGGSDLTKLTIANDSSYNFDPAGTFSVEFWFKNTTIVDEWGDGGSGILFEQLKEGYVDPSSSLWAIRYDTGNMLAIYFKFGENIFSQNYPSAFVINEWIKIKMEYDGISNPGEGRWNLYTSTDGVIWNLLTPGEGSTICTDQYCFYTSLLTTFQIGPTGSGEFHPMEFLIDEVQVNG